MGQLNEEVALRIALAARALDGISVKDLLAELIALVGDPITTVKLNKLRLNRLKATAFFQQVDEQQLGEALNFLKGRNFECEPEPLPEIMLYRDGDMPGSIRVACASNNGEKIDGHFGSCTRFLIYQINKDEIRLVDLREPDDVDEGEDKNAFRASIIDDCQILYTISIGGPAAAKVVRAGLHPIKIKNSDEAQSVLQKLQEILAGLPPPWLAKVMGSEPEARIRFREGVGP